MQQISSFLKQLYFYKKSLHVARFLQSGVLHAKSRHNLWSEYYRQKSELSKCQWSWGVWGCSETPVRVLEDAAPRESF